MDSCTGRCDIIKIELKTALNTALSIDWYKFFALKDISWSYFRQNGHTPLAKQAWFLRVCNTGSMETRWEKEKLLLTTNFSFSHSVFHRFGEPPVIFIKLEIVACKLFQFGTVQNSVVW